MQSGDAVIVRHLPWQPRLLTGFHPARVIAPGRHRLAIDYSGKINTQAVGLFALDYQSSQGPKRALFTQFEASDARRMFPGWDEPNFRTPYDLRVAPTGAGSFSL